MQRLTIRVTELMSVEVGLPAARVLVAKMPGEALGRRPPVKYSPEGNTFRGIPIYQGPGGAPFPDITVPLEDVLLNTTTDAFGKAYLETPYEGRVFLRVRYAVVVLMHAYEEFLMLDSSTFRHVEMELDTTFDA